MRRSDRLFETLRLLQSGKLTRAQDIADLLQVSVRTVYRDMNTLAASGVPVEGARGVGYKLTEATTLPPMTFTPAELEALNLGLAIVMEAADPDLKSAALSLADKIDAGLPTQAVSDTDQWKFANSPFADTARGFAHMPTLRAAVRARQKLRLGYFSTEGVLEDRIVRPLQIEYLGRIWTLTTWCEEALAHEVIRVDLIQSAEALPELFVDEPGKTLAEYLQNR